MAARKVVVTCGGCSKTQAAGPSKIEPCDGYYCMPEHGPILALGQAKLIVGVAAGDVL